MSVQPSKQVIDRQKSSEVVQGTRAQLDAVGEALAARIAPEASREVREAVQTLGRHLLDWLGASTQAMVNADEANARELSDDAGHRSRRDAAAARVSQVLGQLRDVVRAYFDEGVLVQLTVPSALPTDAVVLSRTGLAVLTKLREFAAPKPLLPSMKFVNAEWIALLQPAVDELDAALAALNLDRKENELALTEKQRALAAYDEAFRGTTHALMGLFLAAGRDDLAARVRPSPRRPGQTAETDENPPAPTA